MSGIKIGYDFQAFSLQKRGGITKYFCELIRQMVLLDQDISILGESTGNVHLQEFLGKKYLAKSELNFPLSRKYYFQKNRLATKRQLSGRKFDIFHPTYFDASLLAMYTDEIPLVITMHDFTHELNPSFNKSDPAALHKSAWIDRANGIICISNNTKQDLLKFYPQAQKKYIKVIHHGINIKQLERTAVKKDYILFIGQRSGYKNFEVVLKCLEKHELQLDLYIVGGPILSKTEVRRLQNLKNIEYKQLYPSEIELNTLYQEALALVYPSKYEGFGMPLLEAFANQCPVVCANTSSLPEVAGEAAILFDPNNEAELYTALTHLKNKEKNKEMIEKGLARVKNFSWEKTAQETYNFYLQVIEKVKKQ